MNFAPKQKSNETSRVVQRMNNMDEDVQAKEGREHPNIDIQKNRNAVQRSSENDEDSIQMKLVVGSPNDKFEQEADRTAERVMSRPAPVITASIITEEEVFGKRDESINQQNFLQTVLYSEKSQPNTFLSSQKNDDAVQMSRFIEENSVQSKPDPRATIPKSDFIQTLLTPEPKPAPVKTQEEKKEIQKMADEPVQAKGNARMAKIEEKLVASRSGGEPMSDMLLLEMQARFGGLDFSSVKIHTDSNAIEMCKQLNARAFTNGRHIYFNAGEFNPATTEGKLLLAHELTHTIHQGATSNMVQRDLIDWNRLIEGVSEDYEKLKNTPGWVNTSADLDEYMFRADSELDNIVRVTKPIFAESPEQDRFIMYHYLKTVFRADDSVIWDAIYRNENPTNFVEAYTSIHEQAITETLVSVYIPLSNESFLRGLDKLYSEGRPDIEYVIEMLHLYSPRFTWLDQRNLAGLFQHIYRVSPLEVSTYLGILSWVVSSLYDKKNTASIIVKTSGKMSADLEAFRADKIGYLNEHGLFEAYFTADDSAKATQLSTAVERINLMNPSVISTFLQLTSESSWESHYQGDHPGDSQIGIGQILDYFSGVIFVSNIPNNPLYKSIFGMSEDGFQATGHSQSEVFDFVHLFQEQAMRLAFQMIKKNQELLLQEYIHYLDDDEIAKLFILVGDNFVDPYRDGNVVRARGLQDFFSSKYGDYLRGLNAFDYGVDAAGNGLFTVLFGSPISLNIFDLGVLDSVHPILRRMMGMTNRQIEEELENYSRGEIMSEIKLVVQIREWIDRNKFLISNPGDLTPQTIIAMKFPDLMEAERMDNETDKLARALSKDDFPIMADLSIDPRQITFATRGGKTRSQFRTFIHALIIEKYKNGDDLKEELADNPERVWELDGLIDNAKKGYGIFEGSISDQIINDISSDIASARFWRDIFLGAVGIVLGIAGIFTGGLSTVLGVALLTAGAAISITEFILAKEEYDFTVMSSDTAIGVANELSYKEPNALGMILALIGMGLDVFPLLKGLSALADAAQATAKIAKIQGAIADAYKALDAFTTAGRGASTMSRTDLQKFLLPLYEELGTASTKSFAKNIDDFTDKILDIFKKQKKSAKEMDDILSKLHPDAAARMGDFEKVGWSKIWDVDQELAKRLFTGMVNNPSLIRKIAMQSIVDPNTASNIARLEKLLDGAGLLGQGTSSMRRTLEHVLNKGGSTWSELPVLLSKLEKLGTPPKAMVEMVFAQSRLLKLLKEGDDSAEALYSLWNKYFYGGGNRLGQTFVEFAEGGFRRALKRSSDRVVKNKVGKSDSVFREDDFMHSHAGSKSDRYTSHIDSNGNLRPANPEGNATVRDHIRGSEPMKSDSPFTSFKGAEEAGKTYGSKSMTVDIKRLREDIATGKVKKVKIIEHDEILSIHNSSIKKAQSRYDLNPTARNKERLNNAIRDKEHSIRDNEILIEGIVPKEYITLFE